MPKSKNPNKNRHIVRRLINMAGEKMYNHVEPPPLGRPQKEPKLKAPNREASRIRKERDEKQMEIMKKTGRW